MSTRQFTLSGGLPLFPLVREFLVGLCRKVLQILTRFQTKKCHSPNPQTRVQTRTLKSLTVFRPCPLGTNYVITTQIRAQKKKNYSNPFGIRIFLFLSYSFGIETINKFIHTVVPSKTIPDSRRKWAKCIPVFRPKRRKNPTRWGGTYLYGLYKGVPPGQNF